MKKVEIYLSPNLRDKEDKFDINLTLYRKLRIVGIQGDFTVDSSRGCDYFINNIDDNAARELKKAINRERGVCAKVVDLTD